MEKVVDERTLVELKSLWEQAQHIVVCVHVGPDGDAMGSALALRLYFMRKGKDVHVVVPNAFPDFLKWMPGAGDVLIHSRDTFVVEDIVSHADLLIIADLNSSSRLSTLEPLVLGSNAPRIMIDHHLNPSLPCSLVVSCPHMCATGEILCHLMAQLDELDTLTEEEASCLYAAMMCDTGAFTYASGRAVVYECIGRLIARGIDKDKIYRNVFYTASAARLRLQGYLLYVKMEILKDLNASIITLTNEERKRFGIKNGDTEGFVNIPLQILGMRLSVFLSEDTETPNMVKVSLRSVDDFPCNRMSEEFFSGGGHLNASGGRLFCSMEQAVERVKDAIRKYAPLLKTRK